MAAYTGTITITFGGQVENHNGMQMIGKIAKEGFNWGELEEAKKKFEELGYTCELIDLRPYSGRDSVGKASVLVVRNGVKALLGDLGSADDWWDEQAPPSLEWDKKAFMYGRVVQKKARYNLCYADFSQEPDYEDKKGRIIDFKDLPLTAKVRESLGTFLGEKGEGLYAEGNYYYAIEDCGIGFHGDSERKIVVAFRLGESIPLHYQWFVESKPIGDRVELVINHGDMYVMSEKASGWDWKKTRKIPTLRHAAGAEKFLTIKKVVKRERCEGLTKKKERCKKMARDGQKYCGLHLGQAGK